MSIGQRLVRLVRSNLNTLLDRVGDQTPTERRLEEMSDQELERELTRRRKQRDAAARAVREGQRYRAAEDSVWQEIEDAVRRGSGRERAADPRPPRGQRPSTSGTGPGSSATERRLTSLYAKLECPVGADLNTVRKSYRAMMRKYHPDLHSGDARKQQLATELSQQLTAAYNELRQALAHK